MKLSEQLESDHSSGDFGEALEGYSERARSLEAAILEVAICLEGCRYSEIPMAKKLRAILN